MSIKFPKKDDAVLGGLAPNQPDLKGAMVLGGALGLDHSLNIPIPGTHLTLELVSISAGSFEMGSNEEGFRVVVGLGAHDCHSAYRLRSDANSWRDNYGFRVVFSLSV